MPVSKAVVPPRKVPLGPKKPAYLMLSHERPEEPAPEPPPKKRRKRATYVPWEDIREMWEKSHLMDDGKNGMTLPEVAAKFDVGEQTVYQRSSKEKWAAGLAFKIQNRDAIVAEALKKRSEQAIVALQDDFLANEVEVRRRHAMMAKNLQAKAIKRLATIPIESLKPMEAIAMLRLGLDEERRALGLREEYERPPAEEMDKLDSMYKPVVAQMQDHKRTQQMGVELLRRLQQLQQPATNANILREAGFSDDPPEDLSDEVGAEIDEGEEEDESEETGEI